MMEYYYCTLDYNENAERFDTDFVKVCDTFFLQYYC